MENLNINEDKFLAEEVKKIEEKMKKEIQEDTKENITEDVVIEENKTPEILMERLHIRIFNDTIDVLYRPNHSYIDFLSNDEKGKNRLKELIQMSREEFKNYLDEKNFKRVSKKEVEKIKTSDLEKWYQGAWSIHTNNLLKELGLSNPIEEPIWRE